MWIWTCFKRSNQFFLCWNFTLNYFGYISNKYPLIYCFQQLPIEDLDIFFYPPPLDDVDEYKRTIKEQKIVADKPSESKSL